MGVENFEKVINKLVKSPHGEAEKGKLIMSEKDKENVIATRIGSAIYSRDIHPEASVENPVYGVTELIKRETINQLKGENAYENHN